MLKNPPKWLIIAAVGAAVAASLCCAGPLVLIMLGISGAWIANLTLFEPFRPALIIAVSFFLVCAGWILYRPIEKCRPESVCSVPKNRTRYRIIFWIVSIISLILISSVYWIPLIM